MYRINSLVLFLLLCISIAAGCGTTNMSVEAGNRIDESALRKMIIGKTTRSDVFALLGPPHSIFENQSEFVESHSIMGYSTVQNRYLSSLDDEHYALLYRSSKASSKSTQGFALVVYFKDTQTKISSSEVLLLFNKETDILDDIAYSK